MIIKKTSMSPMRRNINFAFILSSIISNESIAFVDDQSQLDERIKFGNRSISKNTVLYLADEHIKQILKDPEIESAKFNEGYFRMLLDSSDFNISINEKHLRDKKDIQRLSYKDFVNKLVRASIQIRRTNGVVLYDCLADVDHLEILRDPEVMRLMNYFTSSQNLMKSKRSEVKQDFSINFDLSPEKVKLAQDILRENARSIVDNPEILNIWSNKVWENKTWENTTWENRAWENRAWENQTWENQTSESDDWLINFDPITRDWIVLQEEELINEIQTNNNTINPIDENSTLNEIRNGILKKRRESLK